MAALRVASGKALGLGLGRRHGHVRGLHSFSLPDLPYDYGALEPVISAEIMQLHHQKHHQTYVSNYNTALEQLDRALSRGDSPTVVRLQSAIKFNGGGHINHSIFWKNLAPVREGGGERPKDSLFWAIDTQFGSLETLIHKVNAEGAALQGSGWIWLALDKEQKKLSVETTANQDPLVTKGAALVPLFGIDVWEHAYYLQAFKSYIIPKAMQIVMIPASDYTSQYENSFFEYLKQLSESNLGYKNAKADYLTNMWKVMNWKYASEVYEKENP